MLLMLYDKVIASVEACEIYDEAGDRIAYSKHEIQARKAFIAIFSGLKPTESEVAYNVTRLRDFAMFSFDNRNFGQCKQVLSQIRDGFAQISDLANDMERRGEISSMPDSDSFESIA